MKKLILLFVVFIIRFNFISSQWLPLNPISELPHVNPYSYAIEKQILLRDSLVYAIRGGGLEYLNMNDKSINYNFANYYRLDGIVADTGNTYVYWSNSPSSKKNLGK